MGFDLSDIGDFAKDAWGSTGGKIVDGVESAFKGPTIDVSNYTNTSQYDPNAFNGAGQGWVDNALGSQQDAGAQSNAYRNQQAGWNDLGNQSDQRYASAWENQDLANQEAYGRSDQQGSIQLAREAAMGLAPSVAENQLYAGLNQAAADQSSAVGGARGLASLANAQGNAQANLANMQTQASNQAAQLRAGEMEQARGMYGSLAGQNRQMDQNRLQMGNQMSQFNSGARDAYRQAQYGQANQAGQLGLGYGQLGEQAAGRGANTAQGNANSAAQRQEFQYGAFTHGQDQANGASQNDANRKAGMLGAGLAAGGNIAAMAAKAG